MEYKIGQKVKFISTCPCSSCKPVFGKVIVGVIKTVYANSGMVQVWSIHTGHAEMHTDLIIQFDDKKQLHINKVKNAT